MLLICLPVFFLFVFCNNYLDQLTHINHSFIALCTISRRCRPLLLTSLNFRRYGSCCGGGGPVYLSTEACFALIATTLNPALVHLSSSAH